MAGGVARNIVLSIQSQCLGIQIAFLIVFIWDVLHSEVPLVVCDGLGLMHMCALCLRYSLESVNVSVTIPAVCAVLEFQGPSFYHLQWAFWGICFMKKNRFNWLVL
jgi:hypothetical protein